MHWSFWTGIDGGLCLEAPVDECMKQYQLITHALKILFTIATMCILEKDDTSAGVDLNNTAAVGNNKFIFTTPPPGCYWFLHEERNHSISIVMHTANYQ